MGLKVTRTHPEAETAKGGFVKRMVMQIDDRQRFHDLKSRFDRDPSLRFDASSNPASIETDREEGDLHPAFVSALASKAPAVKPDHGWKQATRPAGKRDPAGITAGTRVKPPESAYNPSKATHEELLNVAKGANVRLRELYKLYPKFNMYADPPKRSVTEPAHREEIDRLEGLLNALKDPEKAAELAKFVAANRDEPTYQYIGGPKAVSYHHRLGVNLAKNNVADHGMSDIEKVALFGYTSNDYKVINGALRTGQGNIADPGLKAYVEHIRNAMLRLPPYEPANGAPAVLHRALDKGPYDGWGDAQFVPGNIYSDHAFASASTGDNGGFWHLTINGTQGTRDVGAYSAWPAEKEVLTLPGTKYHVTSMTPDPKGGGRVTLRPVS